MRAFACVVLVTGLGGVASADDKLDATKLLGKWERVPHKNEGNGVPRVVVEFAGMGKAKLLYGDLPRASAYLNVDLQSSYGIEGRKRVEF